MTIDVHAQLAPSRTGQATAVEQSRAVAEVEAAIVVSMRYPRSVPAAIEAMREACKQPKLAEKAFFRFPRGGQNVSGPSIHLARELARVWGNFQYGTAEMLRDDHRGQSEMLAFAWDIQTNTRNSSTFIVPHMRDKKGGPELLTDMRDIYENNANNGARRVREAIFASLPTWFVEEAKDLCAKTLSDGGGKPLATRIADAIATFARIGVTQDQMEAKLGHAHAKWIDQDVATLSVIYRSIQRGEIRKDDEFPDERVTAAEVLGSVTNPAEQAMAPAPPAAPAGEPKTASKAAVERLAKELVKFPLGPDEDVAIFVAWITGVEVPPEELTAGQVKLVTSTLDDSLNAAKGDFDLAASYLWQQYRRATGQLDGLPPVPAP